MAATIRDDQPGADVPTQLYPEWVIQLTLADKAEHTKTIIYYGPFAEYGVAVDHLPAAHLHGRRLGYDPWTGEIRLSVQGRKRRMELTGPEQLQPRRTSSSR